eukprot:4038027-Karenia_brevis.AAC.1
MKSISCHDHIPNTCWPRSAPFSAAHALDFCRVVKLFRGSSAGTGYVTSVLAVVRHLARHWGSDDK